MPAVKTLSSVVAAIGFTDEYEKSLMILSK